MKGLLLVMVVSVAVMSVGCSEEHKDLPTSFIYDPPSVPLDLQVTGGNQQAVLNWDYPSEEMEAIEEFRVYYYFEAYGLIELVGTTNATSYTDNQLVGNLTYCYQVSAVDTAGLEGYRTEAVCVFVGTSD
jgi:fibronectin type 3 domain-containing protein